MEGNLPRPESPQDDSEKKKKKSKGANWAEWLFVERSIGPQEVTIDEEPDVADEDKGNWEKLWDAVKRSVVEVEPDSLPEEDKEGTKDKVKDDVAVISPDAVVEEGGVIDDSIEQTQTDHDQLIQAADGHEDEEPAAMPPTELDHDGVVGHALSGNQDVMQPWWEALKRAETKSGVVEALSEVAAPAETSPEPAPRVEADDAHPEIVTYTAIGPEPEVATERDGDHIMADEIQTVPAVKGAAERRGAASSFLLAAETLELFKTKREQRKQAKKTKQLEKQVKKQQDEIKKLSQLAKPTSDGVNRRPGSVTNERQQLSEFKGVDSLVAAEQALKSVVVPEQVRTVRGSSEDLLSLARRDIVLEKVVEAAEKGQPIERSLERRHEIKGLDDNTSSDLGHDHAAHLSMVTSGEKSTNGEESYYRSTKYEEGVKRSLSTNPSYKRAVTNGFLGAMAIVILGFLAYLVVSG